MSFQLASHPIPTHSTKDIFKYFFSLKDLLNDEFLVYRRQTIKLPISALEEERNLTFNNPGGRLP